MAQTIAVIDFGSQYTQVIARRIREGQVYSKIYHFTTPAAQFGRTGVIGSSCPAVEQRGSRRTLHSLIAAFLRWAAGSRPICYGIQLFGHLARWHDGQEAITVSTATGTLTIKRPGRLFRRSPSNSSGVWNSHGDRVIKTAPDSSRSGSRRILRFAAIEDRKRNFYGLQFHPRYFTPTGSRRDSQLHRRRLRARQDWSMKNLFVRRRWRRFGATVGSGRVILGLSAGVEFIRAAALIHRRSAASSPACLWTTDCLRQASARPLVDLYNKHFHIDLRVADAASLFLRRLKGVTDPERKRKIIGRTFIEVVERSLKSIGHADFLAQGTLYPDVIESVAIGNNPAALIKSHHNVGGLPARMRLRLIEPLRELFKDEVRAVGAQLGLPREVVWRQPFPGPGPGRARGRGDHARPAGNPARADAILQEEMIQSGWYWKVWQSFACSCR